MSVSFRQVWAKLCFRKRAIKMLLSNEKADNCNGTVNVQGDTSGSSKLIRLSMRGLIPGGDAGWGSWV